VNNENVGLCASYVGEQKFRMGLAVYVCLDKNNLNDFYRETYQNLALVFLNPGNTAIFDAEASALEAEGRYADAADYFTSLSFFYKDRADFRYHAGLSYEAAGDVQKAASYYWQVVNLFPEYENAEDCRARYLRLKGVTEVPGLPEGTDIAAETKAPVYEDFLPDA